MSEKNTVMKFWNGTNWVEINAKTTIPLVDGLQKALDDKLNIDIFNKIKRFGFVDNTETTISFDNTNTFTLAKTGDYWSYFRDGVMYNITTDKTITLSETPPANSGIYYIFINDNEGNLSISTTSWNLSDSKVPVAILTWNNSLTPKYFLEDERHTCLMDRVVHKYNHLTRGTQLVSGCELTGYTLNSITNTDKIFGITEAKIADEDLFLTLNTLTKPNGTDTAYTIVYRSGQNYIWTKSNMPFKYTTTGFIEYDNNGTLTPLINNRFCNTYLLLSNILGDSRFIFVVGRNVYNSNVAAYEENFSSFNLTNFVTPEAVAIYQLTWKGVNNAGSGQCVLDRVKKITSNVITTSMNVSVEHNTHNAFTVSYIAGETIPAYAAVRLGNDKKVYVASNTTATLALRTIGVSINSGNINDTIKVVCSGLVTNTSWSWTVNNAVYLSDTSTGLTETAPEEGVLLLIGQCIGTDSIFVHISTHLQ